MTQEEKVMKNLIRKISLIMCVVMLTLAVSACGKSNDDTKKEDTKTEDTAKDTTKDDADDTDVLMQTTKTTALLQANLKHSKIL